MPYLPVPGTYREAVGTIRQDDVVSQPYIPQTITSPSEILMCTDRDYIHHLLKDLDSERHHLQRGLNRLKYENFYLKRGTDTVVGNDVLAPFDARRWTIDRMGVIPLEVLKNEVLRTCSSNMVLVEEQHAMQNENERLRLAMAARRRREEL